MGKFLSDQEIQQYHEQGFVLAKQVYSEADIDQIRAMAAQDYESGQWHTAPYADESVTTDIYNRIPGLAEIVFNENYINICKDLFGDDCFILPEPAFHKNRYYYWHKDSTFIDEQGDNYHLEPGYQAGMTIVYLQGNHPDYGGGLTVVPGTQYTPDFYHKIAHMNIVERAVLKLQKILGISFFDKLEKHPQKTQMPTQVGDMTFIDMRLDHKGTPAKVKPVPYDKYGIMNFACKGKNTADRLSHSLKQRPSGYFKDYLRHEEDMGPALNAIAEKYEVNMQL